MSMLERDGARLRVVARGEGRPFVFQHGLGGDAAQVADNWPGTTGWRCLTLECRAQGASEPGPTRPFSFAMFADDVLAAGDADGIGPFAVGGISMGAAIALRLAARWPERVTALLLVRPAWAFEAAPPTMRPFAEVARLLRAHPPAAARERFAASDTAAMLTREAPDNLASLLKFFDRPDPLVTADLLDDIAGDGPGVTRAQAAAIRVPTLVIGHAVDHVHSLAIATTLADAIPGARLVEVAPKATDRPRHTAELRAAIADFLEHLPQETA
jgi:pimeloyl-ACP methyl ester carboxylesterase